MSQAIETAGDRRDVADDQTAGWALPLMLLFVWLAQVVAHFYWLRQDVSPPLWDPAVHAMATIELARLPWFEAPSAALTGLLHSGPYPPFVYLLAALFGQILEPTIDVFLSVNALFLGVLSASTYAIGRRLGGAHAGFLAALLVSFYPIIFSHARHFMLDLPLTAMVALTIYLLLASNGFADRGLSATLGIVLGLGLLTKWTFAIFLAAPILLTLAANVFRQPRRLRLENGLLALFLAILISEPWYLANAERLLAFLRAAGTYIATLEGDPATGSLWAWYYYPHQLLEQQLFLPLTLLFLLTVPFFWRRHRRSLAAWLVWLWLLVPYLVFALFPNKDLRYMMPALPALAVVSGLGLTQLPRPAGHRWGLVVLALYLVWQFVGLTIGLSARLPDGWLPPRVAGHLGRWPLVLYAENVTFATPPQPVPWPVADVLADVLAAQPVATADQPVRLVVMSNASFFSPQGFRYVTLLNEQPVLIDSVISTEPVDAAGRLAAADYLITKTGNLGPAWTVQDAPALRDSLLTTGSALDVPYTLWHTYPLPDGSTALLWRRAGS